MLLEKLTITHQPTSTKAQHTTPTLAEHVFRTGSAMKDTHPDKTKQEKSNSQAKAAAPRAHTSPRVHHPLA
jgi:hypothetical protein